MTAPSNDASAADSNPFADPPATATDEDAAAEAHSHYCPCPCDSMHCTRLGNEGFCPSMRVTAETIWVDTVATDAKEDDFAKATAEPEGQAAAEIDAVKKNLRINVFQGTMFEGTTGGLWTAGTQLAPEHSFHFLTIPAEAASATGCGDACTCSHNHEAYGAVTATYSAEQPGQAQCQAVSGAGCGEGCTCARSHASEGHVNKTCGMEQSTQTMQAQYEARAKLDTLRSTCEELDAMANRLERQQCYERADELRGMSVELREEARELHKQAKPVTAAEHEAETAKVFSFFSGMQR